MVMFASESPSAHTDPSVLTAEYPAVAASVREAREAVRKMALTCGAPSTRADDIRLAVSEAATNVVMHAYRGQVAGCFRILAITAVGQMLVTVADDGRGLHTPTCAPGLGAGLRIMREVSDEVVIAERATGGSTVALRFNLGAPQQNHPH